MTEAFDRVWLTMDGYVVGEPSPSDKFERTEYIRADLAAPAWQPIETAPKDGARFLALPWTLDLDDAYVTWWIEGYQRWADWDWSKLPAYWARLQEPPEECR